MIKARISSRNDTTIDRILRKVNMSSKTAAGKSAEILADIVRTNIKGGYVDVIGGDGAWKPRWGAYEDRVGWDAGQVIEGDLANSVKVKNTGKGKFEVVVDDPKAVFLEHGGFAIRSDGSFVPPRPFFRPAVHYFEQHNIANSIMIEEMESAA